MINLDVQQGSPEWFAARAGKITASMFRTAVARKETNDRTNEALKYAVHTAVERIAGDSLDRHEFVSWQMRRGSELEPEARAAHQLKIKRRIVKTGVIISDCQRFAGSADGLIGDDGIAEYKALIGSSSLREFFIDGDYSKYVDQCQGLMWLSGRKYCELVVYCPFLSPVERELEIIHVKRNDDYIKWLADELKEFDALVDEYMRKIAGDKYDLVKEPNELPKVKAQNDC